MNKVVLVLSIVLSFLLSCVTQDEEYIDVSILEQEESLINKVRLADPYILLDNGMYYAYGTSNASNGFYVYFSNDLRKWRKHSDYALYKENTFGNMHFWAPEVYGIEDKYYMYYTAEERLAVAISDSPLGPFVQNKGEWGYIVTGYNNLDGTVFEDENEVFLYYVNKTDGMYYDIYVSKMENGKKSIQISTGVKCLTASQDWEESYVNEGPTVVKVGKKYIMTYSACGCTSPNYGVGVAVADDPMGPWVKYEGNPVMQYPAYKGTVLQGTGHNSLFKDIEGNWRMVFHAHSAKGYSGGVYMYIVSVDLMDEPPYIVFHDDLFAPVIAEE